MREFFRRHSISGLLRGGGFANQPRGPGGATMKGVTLKTFQRYKHRAGE
jgi:lysozyme family protein